MMKNAIEVEQLTVVRGRARVLEELDLEVAAGRITGLLGPSGCGKTTLLRCVVGTQRIAAGAVRVLGRPAGSPGLRRRIGYVTQAASVYDDLSLVENLRFFARVLGAPAADVERCISAVDLTGREGQLIRRLSGGQRSRVSLAAALLGSPELLVLDEPTVGLDPVLRGELWELFAALAAAGVTLVVSSHVMDEADRCDDLVLLREGRVIERGTPDEVRARSGSADIEAAFLAAVRGAAA